MDQKTQVIAEYNRLAKKVGIIADEMLSVASRLISISSYCNRKMDKEESSYVKRWIYEVMDILDYSYRGMISEISAFEEVYKEPYDFEKDLELGNIKDVLYDFERVIATYGEMKLSIRPNYTCPALTREEEVEHNLKHLNDED